jgi:hypothetical protein
VPEKQAAQPASTTSCSLGMPPGGGWGIHGFLLACDWKRCTVGGEIIQLCLLGITPAAAVLLLPT